MLTAPPQTSQPVPVPDPGLVTQVRARLGGRTDPALVAAEVHAALAGSARLLGPRALAATVQAVCDEVVGAGPLQPLLDDPQVSDVLVNGPHDVWAERAGALVRVPVDLGDAAGVRALAVRLAAIAGQRLDDACPAVDGRLPDGTRLHALLPPLAGDCTVVSLRVPRARPFTLAELVAAGTVAPALVPVLAALVHTRANLLVSGPTGVGKTTLLAALLGEVAPDQRIVVVEEARELTVTHPHVVHLATRTANVEGAGTVGLTALVRHALRMRPDRIVLGECRGAEVREVLAALNTGHEGGCATLHANAATDVPARLEALGALAAMDPATVAAQAASALDAVIHLRRAAGRRYVAEVGLVARADDGALAVDVAVAIDPAGGVVAGPAWARLAARAADHLRSQPVEPATAEVPVLVRRPGPDACVPGRGLVASILTGCAPGPAMSLPGAGHGVGSVSTLGPYPAAHVTGEPGGVL